MRRSLTWFVAVPLLLASSQAAHFLAYRIVYPGTPLRAQVLLATGHGYLDRLPLVFGAAGAIALVALLVAVVDASRGHAPRALPPWGFGLLAPAAFVIQEYLERSLHSGTFAWHTAAAPTFLPACSRRSRSRCSRGSPPACCSARLHMPDARSPCSRPACTGAPRLPRSARAATPRTRVLARRLAERGPPLPVAV